MITKKYGKDFSSEGGALTLDTQEVTDVEGTEAGVHTRHHDDGWVITGRVHEDYYTWVNSFAAYHYTLGWVCGDFEEEVYASSEEAFNDFYSKHKPEAWDYGDI